MIIKHRATADKTCTGFESNKTLGCYVKQTGMGRDRKI